ncbi:GcrA cell cycle regulator [Methylocystis sp. SC2]|uniref:GcrA cell cycle regulator n=1 Tax=Methylocystis sp. (strain SC2) TaxID=187303 RepID=UPI00027AF020|nr:GcrA cell cycle regulator [Methylocystis sp. SC2]CCJ07072.1 GcrA cell cycle regulator [Methylocystis sp. SC2]
MTHEPRAGSKFAEVLRRARQGATQKQIAAQTGFEYFYVGVALAKLRGRGLLAKPDEIWTDAVLEALRVAIVVDGLKGTAAAARLTQRFERPFSRDQVVGVALRRGWRAGAVDAGAGLAKNPPRWTAAAEAALRAAVADKLSGREAGVRLTEMFKIPYSRNMCIAKAQRLGLQFISEPGPRCAKSAPQASARRAARQKKRAPAVVCGEAQEAWAPQRLALLDMRPGDCRYPLGDPGAEGFGFCGAPARPGETYCAHCARIAYETPAQRRKRRKEWCDARGLRVEREWTGREGRPA